jgi:hypothetical protein
MTTFHNPNNHPELDAYYADDGFGNAIHVSNNSFMNRWLDVSIGLYIGMWGWEEH